MTSRAGTVFALTTDLSSCGHCNEARSLWKRLARSSTRPLPIEPHGGL